MRRTFTMLALCGLAGCYFKTPTHRSERDDEPDGVDAALDDAQVAEDAQADASADDAEEPGCTCSAPTSICITETQRCVECQADGDCAGGMHCLLPAGQCVPCLSAGHCANLAAASVCDADTHRCVPCQKDTECDNVPDADVCNAGTCVQCTPDQRGACGEDKAVCNDQFRCVGCTADADCMRFGKVCDEPSGRCVSCTLDSEQGQCGAKSCNPQSKQCTDTTRGSVGPCRKCVADSECMTDHRCIELFFSGEARGGYCMKRAADCMPPFQATPIRRASLSGAAAEDYCGISETRTSCEAVLALSVAQTCSDAAQCNAPGALCASINSGKTCTYACESSLECPSGIPCGGTGSDKYCGR